MYIADLHIHSRYSRATSRDCTPEALDFWAKRKGIGILGTGDFTHPAWRQELAQKLVPSGDGLYTLRKEFCRNDGSFSEGRAPRFVITGEISSIYKKNGKVRKVHSLILLPGLEEAERLSLRLEAIGNIHSDGRPILGLDCHDLLEITLEACPDAIYVPAHIWTPHFSLFGAFSGFDAIEECYGDLTGHIHALETGLSSDPPMNWRLSALDSYQLISNSDAHSPAKLGREANLLDIPLSYEGLSAAIQTGQGLCGTIEFFPEEGKYHFDGHRKCHLCLSPEEASSCLGVCPVCGRRLTMGVLHRVEQLADRAEGFLLPGAKPYESLVPLAEVIAASTGRSAAGAKVMAEYENMLGALGPEFSILREVPIEAIRKTSGPMIAEGIRRLRDGLVERSPGFDGEYGAIKLFSQSEIQAVDGQMSLFSASELETLFKPEAAAAKIPAPAPEKEARLPAKTAPLAEFTLNQEQLLAVQTAKRALAVIAGPGTGKTSTLTARIHFLLSVRNVKPSEITAVTFTNKAAGEIHGRLINLPGCSRAARGVNTGTFHSICLELLRSSGMEFTLAGEYETADIAEEAIRSFCLKISPAQFLREVSLIKTGLVEESASVPKEAAGFYQERLSRAGVLDFDDLLLETLRLLQAEEKRSLRKNRFQFLLVDEFQDINPLQYRLLCAWNRDGKEIFVIGDPDQSIYSFRGSDTRFFQKLGEDWPELSVIRLTESYRSTPQIIGCALAAIAPNKNPDRFLRPLRPSGMPVIRVPSPSGMSEAIFIAREINRLVGGIDMLDTENGRSAKNQAAPRSFSDIAILYRTHRQAGLLETCLRKEGIPYIVTGREDFLSDRTVRGVLCFFRFLAEPEDTFSRALCLKLLWNQAEEDRNTGEFPDFHTLSQQYSARLKKTRPEKLIDALMKELDLTECEPLKKLAGMSVFYKNMEAFLQSLALGKEGELRRCPGKAYSSDAVTLMTFHGSKGLEFPAVFLYGLKKGLLPLEGGSRPADIEEERRLFYVGITRAKEELFLLSSPEPSPFLADIPKELMQWEEPANDMSREGKQLSLFDFIENLNG